MTGMGRARGAAGSSVFSVEIKSVNHRYCEVHARLPARLQSLEIPVVNRIKKEIHRGKVDVWIGEEKSGEASPVLNRKALASYYRFLNEIRGRLKLAEPVNLSHIQAGASFWMAGGEEAGKVWPVVKKLVEKALDDLVRMRGREGKLLQKNIASRLKTVEELAARVAGKKEEILLEGKAKLERRIQKLLGGNATGVGPVSGGGIEVDQGKLANEVAFMADRGDVTEELERLSSHFAQMARLLKDRGPSGRPIDFLIQEMNREWNTIASKTQNAGVAQMVVEAKCEMEKIREQVQNIE